MLHAYVYTVYFFYGMYIVIAIHALRMIIK